jgi:chaperonin cofactor prefoldin
VTFGDPGPMRHTPHAWDEVGPPQPLDPPDAEVGDLLAAMDLDRRAEELDKEAEEHEYEEQRLRDDASEEQEAADECRADAEQCREEARRLRGIVAPRRGRLPEPLRLI